MGVFEMIVLVVLISTVGGVLGTRRAQVEAGEERPGLKPGEVEDLRQAVDELSSRVGRLEEERDFYRELLEAPERQRRLGSPDDPAQR